MITPVYDYSAYARYHGYGRNTLLARDDTAFWGHGWSQLSLPETPSGQTLAQIVANRHPLKPDTHLRPRDSAVAGFSWLLTCDKSISIASALRPIYREMSRMAMIQTLVVAESLAGFARLRSGADHKTDNHTATRNVTGVIDFDTENRCGEPCEHGDAFCVNLTFTTSGAKALYPTYYYQYQLDLADFQQLLLAHLLWEHGDDCTYRDGVTSLDCVPKSMCKAHSSRSDQIASLLKARGLDPTNRRARATAQAQSAGRKRVEKAPEEMIAMLRSKSARDCQGVEEALDAVSASNIPRPKPDPADAEVQRIMCALADRMEVFPAIRMACAVAREAPGRIDPRSVLARCMENYRPAKAAPHFVRTNAVRKVQVGGIPLPSRSEMPLTSTFADGFTPPPRNPFVAATRRLLSSRSAVVPVTGTPRQLAAFAQIVLRTPLSSRRSVSPVVQAISAKLTLVDARRCSPIEALNTSVDANAGGKRVVLLLSRRAAGLRDLRREMGMPIDLKGERRMRSHASVKQSQPITALVAWNTPEAQGPGAIKVFAERHGRLVRSAPSALSRTASSLDTVALAAFSRETRWRFFRQATVRIHVGADIAYCPKAKLDDEQNVTLRGDRVGAVMGGRILVTEAGVSVDPRDHHVVVLSQFDICKPDLSPDRIGKRLEGPCNLVLGLDRAARTRADRSPRPDAFAATRLGRRKQPPTADTSEPSGQAELDFDSGPVTSELQSDLPAIACAVLPMQSNPTPQEATEVHTQPLPPNSRSAEATPHDVEQLHTEHSTGKDKVASCVGLEASHDLEGMLSRHDEHLDPDSSELPKSSGSREHLNALLSRITSVPADITPPSAAPDFTP